MHVETLNGELIQIELQEENTICLYLVGELLQEILTMESALWHSSNSWWSWKQNFILNSRVDELLVAGKAELDVEKEKQYKESSRN